MTSKIQGKKCDICGKPVFSNNSDHCRRCAVFVRCMDQRGIHADAAKKIKAHLKRHGFVCQYTRRKLNLTNPQSPFYFVFDHQIPGDERTVVLTFALLNEMKSDMTWKEFKYYLRQLYNNIFFGTPIIEKKLVYWARLLALNSARKSRLPKPLHFLTKNFDLPIHTN